MKRIPSKGIRVIHNEVFDWLMKNVYQNGISVEDTIGDFSLYNELDQITKRDEED